MLLNNEEGITVNEHTIMKKSIIKIGSIIKHFTE